jgi:hypothetical protein
MSRTDGDRLLPAALDGVAALTVASGLLQVVAPQLVLQRLARDPDRLSAHFFGTVGMFMTVSGGTLHRALHQTEPDGRLLAWSVAQKLGASGAVAIAVRRRLLSPLALAVAAFDLASGILCLVYRLRLRRGGAGA